MLIPKDLKQIRRYGFHARNIKINLKNKFKLLLKKSLLNTNLLTWRERIFKFYGRDPFIYPNCFSELKSTSFHHKKYGDLYYP